MKLNNPRIAEALVAGGGLAVLLAAGFRSEAEPSGERVAVFPEGASVELLAAALRALLKKPEQSAPAAAAAAEQGRAAEGEVAGVAATAAADAVAASVSSAATQAPPQEESAASALLPPPPSGPEPAQQPPHAAAAGAHAAGAPEDPKAAFQRAVKDEFDRLVGAGTDRQQAAVAALTVVMARFSPAGSAAGTPPPAGVSGGSG